MKNRIALLLLLMASYNINATELSPKGVITGYYTGWGSDTVRVTIQGASYNEGNCATPDGYVTAKSDNSGYTTHASALLAAYMSGKPVTIVVNGCVSGRPRIWGVYID